MVKPIVTRPLQVVAVTGAKGGVGKTHVAVNMAVSLAKMKKKVFLLDADFGLSNIDILLGIKPVWTLANVLANEITLKEIVMPGPFGLNIIPGISGFQNLTSMQANDYGGIIHSFSSLSDDLDVLVVDTAAGISESVIRFSIASQEILVVVSNEPTSLADAYALIKLLNKKYNVHRFRIVVNMVNSAYEAEKIFSKLSNVADKYLNIVLHYLCWIPHDELFKKATMKQKSLVEAYPSSNAALSFNQLAKKILDLNLPYEDRGQAQFFIEKIKQPIMN